MDADAVVAAPATPSRAHALAGLLLLALWLGWTLPALWAQAPADRSMSWTDAQVLAQIPQTVMAAGAGRSQLLLGRKQCDCPASTVPTNTGNTVAVDQLSFEWVVLDAGQRLVYAGPALLDLHCGGGLVSAAPLVTRLLARPQPPLILPDRCSCRKE